LFLRFLSNNRGLLNWNKHYI
ncbi:hypothetical protein A5798_002295, partial [Enterococcus sp. 6C8_DIV0013]